MIQNFKLADIGIETVRPTKLPPYLLYLYNLVSVPRFMIAPNLV